MPARRSAGSDTIAAAVDEISQPSHFLDDDNEDGAELMTGINLTADQREKIDDIIDRQEDELEDYWESRMPEIRTVLDGTYAEIRALLDPSQQQQFDRKVASLGGQIPVEFRD